MNDKMKCAGHLGSMRRRTASGAHGPSAAGREQTCGSSLRAQAAVETLMMMGLVITFMLPLILLFSSSTGQRSEALNSVQATALAQSLADTAGEVWYGGNGTQKLMLVSFPTDLKNISLGGDFLPDSSLPSLGHEITLTLDTAPVGVSDIVIESPGPVRSVPPSYAPDGITPLSNAQKNQTYLAQKISTNPNSHLSSGLVVLIFQNKGNYVNIIRKVYGVT